MSYYPLLVLYGSQTGNAQVRLQAGTCVSPMRYERHCAHLRVTYIPSYSCGQVQVCLHASQDVAERIAREARLLHYFPRVMAMDAYPVTELPEEKAVVFVTATAGQVSTTGTSCTPSLQAAAYKTTSYDAYCSI